MRFLLRSIATLTTFLLAVHGIATATRPQGAANTAAGGPTDKPLTGRAIRCEQGKILSFGCQNVELLAYLPKDSIGRAAGTDLWGWQDSATGREFLIITGDSAPAAFVEVTDPLHPKYLGLLPPHPGAENHLAGSVKVHRNHAFIGYEAAKNGIQIFDLTQLRAVKGAPAVFQATAHYDSLGNTHTIAVNPETEFLYVNGSNTCNGGLHMLDVRTPAQPTFVGCHRNAKLGDIKLGSGIMTLQIGGPGYVHDTQCLMYRGPDPSYKGREICVNATGDAVVLVDVTDKKQPKTLSIVRYPNIVYAHQGWFTEDQQYFFLDDELDEGAVGHTRTMVFDMKDLDDPVVLSEFRHPYAVTDHNLYIRGRYMYQGNNRAGLRIIDVADPKAPKEVGYLTDIGLAWAAYPFLKNDVVAVSTRQGLFLARLVKP